MSKPMTPLQKYIAEREAAFAAKYPTLAKANKPRRAAHDPSAIRLGYDGSGVPVLLTEKVRREHVHCIGTTGSGKTTELEYMIKQDIVNSLSTGCGLCLMDPDGGHPGSLFRNILTFLNRHGMLDTSRVHIISPNVRGQVVGFNPLARLPDTDLSVIADALIVAFERVWGDEDTQQKPNIRSVLRATFVALAERGMNLTDAKLLYDPDDRHGLRARIIQQLQNEYARDELDRLHQLSLDPRTRQDFQSNVIGPINRLNEFVSSEAIAAMFGMNRDDPTSPAKTIDLLSIMERGDIQLIDLQQDRAVSQANSDLLGKLFLRYMTLLASHRSHTKPFYLYVDECYRYLTADIQELLARMRKWGLCVHLAHQWLDQLGKKDDPIYQAVMKSTNSKVVFAVASPEDAQTLAEFVIPLDIGAPNKQSVRPVQTGFVVGRLNNESASQGESRTVTDSLAQTHAVGDVLTEMAGWSDADVDGTVEGKTLSSGQALSRGDMIASHSAAAHGSGTHLQYDPNTNSLIPMPIGVGMSTSDNVVAGDSSGRSMQRSDISTDASSTSRMRSHISAITGGVARSRSEMDALTKGRSDSIGTSQSQSKGSSEALFPVFQNLATGYLSKEDLLYQAGEAIRALPVGHAIYRYRGTPPRLFTVPLPNKKAP